MSRNINGALKLPPSSTWGSMGWRYLQRDPLPNQQVSIHSKLRYLLQPFSSLSRKYLPTDSSMQCNQSIAWISGRIIRHSPPTTRPGFRVCQDEGMQQAQPTSLLYFASLILPPVRSNWSVCLSAACNDGPRSQILCIQSVLVFGEQERYRSDGYNTDGYCLLDVMFRNKPYHVE